MKGLAPLVPIKRERTAFENSVAARIRANAVAGLTTNPNKVRKTLRSELGQRKPKSIALGTRQAIESFVSAEVSSQIESRLAVCD